MINPYFQDKWVTIYHGDCREILPQLRGTGIITDPPYELGFMGKDWDKQGVSFQKETWQVIRQSCLPGAMLLSFGGTRTFHRIACAIEDAGFEYRDTIMWLYAQGFPKSLDISKAIDKQAGVKRTEVIGTRHRNVKPFDDIDNDWNPNNTTGDFEYTAPATPEAQLWAGYRTALKPAYEPILVCMNPLDGTFANNALKHGVAGLNIDGCRITTNEVAGRPQYESKGWKNTSGMTGSINEDWKKGRFPANIIHDGSEEVLELFPNTKAGLARNTLRKNTYNNSSYSIIGQFADIGYGDSGSAARFFYCAKASKSERGEGNNHPTVKPLALMKYLVKLISPPKDAVIIDPFMGSGTTLVACKELGIKCIGIDTDEYTCEIAVKRCEAVCRQEVMELKI